MKTLLALLAACLFLLPVSASASSIDVVTSGGILQQFSNGLSSTGDKIDFVGFGGKTFLGNLGYVNFSTGPLISGSLETGAVFGAGGSFAIIANGTDNFHNGVLFTGSFFGPTSWNVINLKNGKQAFTLIGALKGKWFNGATVNGAVTELTVIGEFDDGNIKLTSGDLNLNGANISPFGVTPVPEPTALLYLGTGIVGIVGAVRCKRIL